MKRRIYLYPFDLLSEQGGGNPYLFDLKDSLELWFAISNLDMKRNFGVIGLIKAISKTDIFVLNWIENIVDRRFGSVQYFMFFIFLLLCRLRKKKLIWTLHNKYSHNKNNLEKKKKIIKIMAKNADMIITHSQEGVEFLKKYGRNHNVFFFPHPISNSSKIIKSSLTPLYDFIIWGAISPYKGILEFIRFLRSSSLASFKVIVAGECKDLVYSAELMHEISNLPNIEWFNKRPSDEELNNLFSLSRCILFTYHSESILSSASLIRSLNSNCNIIGPNVGSFLDLQEMGIIKVYSSFNDIRNLVDFSDVEAESRSSYFLKYSWEAFGSWFHKVIDKL